MTKTSQDSCDSKRRPARRALGILVILLILELLLPMLFPLSDRVAEGWSLLPVSKAHGCIELPPPYHTWDPAPADLSILLHREYGGSVNITNKTLHRAFHPECYTMLSQYIGWHGSSVTDWDTYHYWISTGPGQGYWVTSPHYDSAWANGGTLQDVAVSSAGTYQIVMTFEDDHLFMPGGYDGLFTRSATAKVIRVDIPAIGFIKLLEERTLTATVTPPVPGTFLWGTWGAPGYSGSGVRFVWGGSDDQTYAEGQTVTIKGKTGSPFIDYANVGVTFTSQNDDLGYAAQAVNAKSLSVVEDDMVGVVFTTDHGRLIDVNTSFSVGSGSLCNPRGWVKAVGNKPVTHTKDIAPDYHVTVLIRPQGIPFDLTGDGPAGALDLHKTGLISNGGDYTIPITADAKLPNNIGLSKKTCGRILAPVVAQVYGTKRFPGFDRCEIRTLVS